MRQVHSFRSLALPLMLALAAAQPTALSAQKGNGSSGNPEVDFESASQCAGLYRFLLGMLPEGSPPREQAEVKMLLWLAEASGWPGGIPVATAAADRQAQSLREKAMTAGGDEDALAPVMGPLNEQCDAGPIEFAKKLAARNTPPPAARIAKPNESTIRASEGKMECAGLHRYYEARGGASTMFFGNSKLFTDAAVKDRPDLSHEEIDTMIEAHRTKWAAAYKKATDDYSSALMNGETAQPKLPDGLTELSENCDNAVQYLR